ncbi:hypothetical protein DN546_38135, partial [Burkholderia multivorans]
MSGEAHVIDLVIASPRDRVAPLVAAEHLDCKEEARERRQSVTCLQGLRQTAERSRQAPRTG